MKASADAMKVFDSHWRYAANALEVVQDAYVTLDTDFTIIYANPEVARLNHKPIEKFLGRNHWHEFPAAVGTPLEDTYRAVMRDRVPRHLEHHYFVPGEYDLWVAASAYPDEERGGIHVVVRDITEQKEREHRDKILADFSERTRTYKQPESVIADAVQSIGEHFQAARCVFADIDLEADTTTIHRSYRAEGSEDVPSVQKLSSFGAPFVSQMKAGRAVFIEDVLQNPMNLSPENVAAFEAIGVRAHISMPLLHAGQWVCAMGVHSNTPRVWKSEDIDLVRTVVEKTWLTIQVIRQNKALSDEVLERRKVEERLKQSLADLEAASAREHAIAEQLQQALVPNVPEAVPGLALKGFYRAALHEAGVGGDFSDVFTVTRSDGSGNVTCLVCADLSGKGLAAASQVATVRNMIRYVLHADGSLATALNSLNQVLVEQSLLRGFATLFVGIFDPETRVLTYVNCGQEPGVIWRAATGEVELLQPTGSILGGFKGAQYEEMSVILNPSDIFALITDGMTEVGPTRKEHLEIEGFASLFASCCVASSVTSVSPTDTAASTVQRLISGIELHAKGPSGIRDDIALLVGVVTPQ